MVEVYVQQTSKASVRTKKTVGQNYVTRRRLLPLQTNNSEKETM